MPGLKLLFVSYDGLIADIAWQVVKEGHEVRFWIKDAEEREIADGFVPKSRRLDAGRRLGRRGRVRRRARAWAPWPQELRKAGKLRGRRHALHRPARGRPRLRPAGAEGGRRLDHPAGELHLLRRRDGVRAREPEPLRDQAERRGAELQAPALRGRGGGRPRRGRRCSRTTSAPGRRRSRSSSSSAGSWASRSRPAPSSTARSS